jgi:hypothetical protein
LGCEGLVFADDVQVVCVVDPVFELKQGGVQDDFRLIVAVGLGLNLKGKDHRRVLSVADLSNLLEGERPRTVELILLDLNSIDLMAHSVGILLEPLFAEGVDVNGPG